MVFSGRRQSFVGIFPVLGWRTGTYDLDARNYTTGGGGETNHGFSDYPKGKAPNAAHRSFLDRKYNDKSITCESQRTPQNLVKFSLVVGPRIVRIHRTSDGSTAKHRWLSIVPQPVNQMLIS